MPPPTPPSFSPRWIVVFLSALTLLAFAGVQNADFVQLDDATYIYENPELRKGFTLDSLNWAFGSGLWRESPHAEYWQPITLIARLAITQAFGLHPAMHHLVNLILHLIMVIFLWYLLRKMTGSLLRSALVAALFAVHPLRVESVAWVTELKDLLSGLFFLLTLWAYLRYIARPNKGRSWTVAGCFLLGLMSKPMIVTLPCLLLLLDFWPLRRASLKQGDLSSWIRLTLEKSLLFGLALGSGLLTLKAQSHMLGINPHIHPFLHVLSSYGLYLRRIIFPWPLAVHYPPMSADVEWGWILVGTFLLVGISTIAWKHREDQPWLFVGWSWFVLTLAPVSGLGDISTADRFTYIPSIGFNLALVWCGHTGIRSLAKRQGWDLRQTQIQSLVLSVVLLIVLTMISQRQTSYWKNTRTLMEHSLVAGGDDYLVHDTLADIYMTDKLPDQALYHFNKAVAMAPGYPEARLRLARALLHLGKLPEAAQVFAETLKLDPMNPEANLLLAHFFASRSQDIEAIPLYERYLQSKPDDALAHYNLGVLLARQDHPLKAIPHIETVLRLSPNFPQAARFLQTLRSPKKTTHSDSEGSTPSKR